MTIPNQAPDSSVAGALQGTPEPTIPNQVTGDAFQDYLQQFIAAVAGMDGKRVIPGYQTDPVNRPDFSIDWAAFTINEVRPIGLYTPVTRHPEGNGSDEIRRQEEFDLFITFYGPNSRFLASNLRDGLAIWQNYSMLRLASMALVEVGTIHTMTEMVKQQWVGRADVSVTIRRYIRRTYPVLNLLSAQAKVQTDSESRYEVEVEVDPPTP